LSILLWSVFESASLPGRSLLFVSVGRRRNRSGAFLFRVALDEIENRLQLEKARAFDLPGLADRNAADVIVFRQGVKFRARKPAPKIIPSFWRPDPDGKLPVSIL
jgi:hypothetical protein